MLFMLPPWQRAAHRMVRPARGHSTARATMLPLSATLMATELKRSRFCKTNGELRCPPAISVHCSRDTLLARALGGIDTVVLPVEKCYPSAKRLDRGRR